LTSKVLNLERRHMLPWLLLAATLLIPPHSCGMPNMLASIPFGIGVSIMAEKPKTDYHSKLGPIPPDHFDNDLPFNPVDKSPGSLYDRTKKRIDEALKDTGKK
jgi:hypothetical protein